MNYLDWNNHIANFFFRTENAGKDIHFYLTKHDLIKYSRPNFSGTSDEEIWADFIFAIKYDQQEKNANRGASNYTGLNDKCELILLENNIEYEREFKLIREDKIHYGERRGF